MRLRLCSAFFTQDGLPSGDPQHALQSTRQGYGRLKASRGLGSLTGLLLQDSRTFYDGLSRVHRKAPEGPATLLRICPSRASPLTAGPSSCQRSEAARMMGADVTVLTVKQTTEATASEGCSEGPQEAEGRASGTSALGGKGAVNEKRDNDLCRTRISTCPGTQGTGRSAVSHVAKNGEKISGSPDEEALMIFKSPSGEMGGWAGGAQMQRSQRRWPYGDKAEVVARAEATGQRHADPSAGAREGPSPEPSAPSRAALTDVPRDPGENRWAQVSDAQVPGPPEASHVGLHLLPTPALNVTAAQFPL